MRRFVAFLLIANVIIILSGCNTVDIVTNDGITRTTSKEENLLQSINENQFEVSPAELLNSLPQVWEDTTSLENGKTYILNAMVNGGDLSSYVEFDLIEIETDIEMLKELLMGDRRSLAIETDDVSAEGQKYWAVVDPESGRNLEELHYYVYKGTINDLFDYQRDTLIYDDKNQEIMVSDAQARISASDAINTTADVLAHMGYSGMTILDGYDYQTEITFYFLPQYMPLPVVADKNDAQMIRIKSTVCDDGVTELCGNGIFRRIANLQEVEKVMNFDGILSLAKTHLKSTASTDLPPVSEVSLRHRYTYNEDKGTISANLVWYFEIPQISVEDQFGVGTYNYSFAIDAISGMVYGGF